MTVTEPTLPSPLEGDGNLAALLSIAALRWGGRTALSFEGQAFSFAELDGLATRAATRLRAAGVRPGDRVGMLMGNSPAFVAIYFGILRAGAIVVPMNPLASPAEVEKNFGDAEVSLVVAGRGQAEAPTASAGPPRCQFDEEPRRALADVSPEAPLTEVESDETAVILYTSGTTGRPKGAELTHANLGRNANAAVQVYGLKSDDVLLGALPLYHTYALTCTLGGSLAAGARLSLIRRFDVTSTPRIFDADGVTVFLGVPTMFTELVHAKAHEVTFATLRMCSSGGAPLPLDIIEAFEARAGVPVFEGYGLTETSPIASFNGSTEPRRPGSVGRPIPGVQMRVVDEGHEELPRGQVGEIAIRGHNIMKGYWKNSEATAEAIDAEGWFYSGDLGTEDADGYFRIVGRRKDMIIRGGLNVYPRELEDLMREHAAVRDVAVIGIEDHRLGEEVAAAVVLEPGAEASLDELRDWVRERVAPHKYPRHLWSLAELPANATGKVLKRDIAPPEGLASAAGGR